VIPLGRAEVKREGSDVTLISWSLMALKCLEAAAVLAAKASASRSWTCAR